jgi:inorganic pyrophosphatase-like protein
VIDLYEARAAEESRPRRKKILKGKRALEFFARKVAAALRKRPGTASTSAAPGDESSLHGVLPLTYVAREQSDVLGSLAKHSAIEKAIDVAHVETMPRRLMQGKPFRENRKLHYRRSFQDLPISVENRPGSIRRGFDKDGSPWETKMRFPYGYIPGTEGTDGDALDVFVGPNENAAYAYVVHCMKPETGDFDEDKVMLGFNSSERAEEVFRQHYDDPKFFGGIVRIPMWRFHKIAFVKKHTTEKLVAAVRLDLGTGGRLREHGLVYDPADTGIRMMRKSILGHHRAEQTDPHRRESRESGEEKKTACYDFDGVVAHTLDEDGYENEEIGEPLKAGIEAIKKDHENGDRIVILTARGPEVHRKIEKWLEAHDVPFDEVTNVKPPAYKYVDDRAEEWPSNKGARESAYREHGVKGMRWGQRRQRDQVRTRSRSRRPGRIEDRRTEPTSRARAELGMKTASHEQMAQALRTENLHIQARLRLGQGSSSERQAAEDRIEENRGLIADLDKLIAENPTRESGFREYGIKGMKWGQRREQSPKVPENGSGLKVHATLDNIEKKSNWGEVYYQWKDVPGLTGSVVKGTPMSKSELQEKFSTLYHVTTNLPAVEESGYLRAGSTDTQGGLGSSGQASAVSFTSDKKDADDIKSDLLHAGNLIRGGSIEYIKDWAKDDEKRAGLKEGTLDKAVAGAVNWYNMQKGGKGQSLNDLKDAMNQYLWSRETSGGPQNTVLVGPPESFAKIKPEHIGILEVPTDNIPEKALIRNRVSDDFLHEVQVDADVPIKAHKVLESLRLAARIQRFREAVRGKYKRKPIVYYARPLQMYGTALEAGDIEQLRQAYPGHRIRVLRTCEKKRRGMGYYHQKVEESDIVAVRPMRKNRLSAGVWSEARHALKKGIRVVAFKRGQIRTIHEARLHRLKAGKRRNPAGHFGFVKSKPVTQAELRKLRKK